MNVDEILKGKIPQHVAIILDGNGRWAKSRGLPRNLGHRKGAFTLRDTLKNASNLGIKELTVYAFSTENWKRDKDEVFYLMNQPLKYFKRYKKRIVDSNYKITFIGRRDRFSNEMLNMINDIEDFTKDKEGLHLNIAFDYGSKEEIVNACKLVCKDLMNNSISLDDIDENLFESKLYTNNMLPVDLLIRTSGEVRLSNYLLWQLAYSEMYFTKTYWPDFNNDELLKAIDSFQNRERRFGGLK